VQTSPQCGCLSAQLTMAPSTLRTFATLVGVKAVFAQITTAPTATTRCTSTVCADYINSCGQTYGGCYPLCSGDTAPTFTDPGCPTTTPAPITTCTETICADYINSCGQWYGGCFPACSGYTTPSFTVPDCPTTTSVTSTTCTDTICADYVNSCGRWYGGCYAACSGYTTPTFTDPGCPNATTITTTTPLVPTITTSRISESCNHICVDSLDECGQLYGPGCFTTCPGVPWPSYTGPSCSLTATSTAGPVTLTGTVSSTSLITPTTLSTSCTYE